jgi:hypothetical protein
MHPVRHLRYRLTVDVEDQGKIKSGEGVVEFAYPSPYETFRFYGGYLSPVEMSGHPITVDLGHNDLLFVMDWKPTKTLARTSLSKLDVPDWELTSSLADLPITLYRVRNKDWRTSREKIIENIQKEPKDVLDVPIQCMPAVVHFKNINFPSSLEEVDPSSLPETFEPGVRIMNAKLQLTDDPVTATPEVWPDWLKHPDPKVKLDLRYGPNGSGHEVFDAPYFAGK